LRRPRRRGPHSRAGRPARVVPSRWTANRTARNHDHRGGRRGGSFEDQSRSKQCSGATLVASSHRGNGVADIDRGDPCARDSIRGNAIAQRRQPRRSLSRRSRRRPPSQSRACSPLKGSLRVDAESDRARQLASDDRSPFESMGRATLQGHASAAWTQRGEHQFAMPRAVATGASCSPQRGQLE
jgi:hypothetical protein